MSTRANIIVVDDSTDKLYFYRHSDGYPSGALPVLKKFMSYVKKGIIRDNVSQAAGWLIMLGNEEYEVGIEPIEWKVGSIEPSIGLHGDIEYLYILNLKHKTITVTDVSLDGTPNEEPLEIISEF